MDKRVVFSLVAVTMLLMTAIPFMEDGSNGGGRADTDDYLERAYYAGNETEEKKICNATLEDNFADNGILIVLSKEASLSFREYTLNDFAETECSKVMEITKELSMSAKKQYNIEKLQKETEEHVKNDIKLDRDIGNYRTVLYLELTNGGKENVLEAIKQLEERDDVISVEPNFIYSASATPNDPYLGNQWAINNIGLPNAWNVTTGSSTVTVAVLDTGIDGNHPDLTNRINKSLCRDFTSGKMVTVTNPTDPNGHGTHVAGIIGAQGNNNTGVAGTNWDVRLVSLRVLDASGNGLTSNIILAIDFACNQGIQILNLSLGTTVYSSALAQIIDLYYALFVCAAGNANSNNDGGTKVYPASLRLPNVISVGATNESNGRAVPGNWGWITSPIPQGSNYGATTVDVFAPGTYILSTYTSGQYAYMSGTSMAAPYVAGVAALLLTKNLCSPFGLKTLIMNNVDKISGLSGLCVSGGKLNAQKAVNANLFGGGTGTSGNPYQISTPQHLKDIENYSTYNAYYKVMANITLSGNWMPTLDTTQPNILYGVFDGNGKTISGLSSTTSTSGYFGLFHETRGTIKKPNYK